MLQIDLAFPLNFLSTNSSFRGDYLKTKSNIRSSYPQNLFIHKLVDPQNLPRNLQEYKSNLQVSLRQEVQVLGYS